MPVLEFPDGFLWGTATASYQIEGSPLADGAGPSIWHTFAHTPGTIHDGDTADVTCDHYRRYREDVALMRELGLQAYRFSVAWPRVFPAGYGDSNSAGLAFYDRLVDELLAAGITPMATLYHWDLPQALEDEGGWPNSDLACHFADYAEHMFDALGDRVKLWITFNEPWVFTYLGYGLGVHAPGTTDMGAALKAGHTALRAHGMAVERFRSLVPDGEIGITLSVQAQLPASDTDEDRQAAMRSSAFYNEWFIEPIVCGDYPPALRDQFGELLPEMGEADRATIQRPIDFIGLNYYTRLLVENDENAFLGARPWRVPGHYTAMDWEIYPAGLYHLLKTFYATYGLPLYITENGAGLEGEKPGADGAIDDVQRLRYLQSHIEMAHRATSEGVDLRGYMAWSFIDNFEWSFGFAKRFGLVYCDYETQARTPKLSAAWYRRVIKDNGI